MEEVEEKELITTETKKEQFNISVQSLKEIGVDPDVIVNILEKKKAKTLKPVHVTLFFALKRAFVSVAVWIAVLGGSEILVYLPDPG